MNDYVDNEAVNISLTKRFLNRNYLFIRYGDYQIVVKYGLPGGEKITEFVYKFRNNNNFR
jgi:hypothetical protein